MSENLEKEPARTSFKERYLSKGSLGRFAVKTLIVVGIAAPAFTLSAERVIDHSRKPVADSFAESVKPQIDNQGQQLRSALDTKLDGMRTKVDNIAQDANQALTEINQFKELLTGIGLTVPEHPQGNGQTSQQAAPPVATTTTATTTP